jgi:DNA-binding NtrC family response regulator
MTKAILLIEDSEQKTRAIRGLVDDNFPEIELVTTDTIIVGGKLLADRPWLGIILDLAFQRSQNVGGQLQRPYLAGIEILQQLKETRLPIPVVITTQHASFRNTLYGDFTTTDEVRSTFQKAFPRNLKEIIEVDWAKGDWLKELNQAIRRHFS